MTIRLISVWLGLAAALWSAGAMAEERNTWPGPVVREDPSGGAASWTAAGPLLFSEPASDGGWAEGFRPFYVRQAAPVTGQVEVTSLYPLFSYRSYGDAHAWSFFELINRYGGSAPAGPGSDIRTLDIWPFYFSRDTGDPATSYQAVMPITGTIKERFGFDRISWVLFPFYLRTESRGATTTSAPWPFVRATRGAEQGFALWPLYGRRERPGAFVRQYALWPLFWDNAIQPGAEAAPGTPPTREVGVLPLYTSERGPGLVNECYLWPFFGYTDRTVPYRYSEVRYLWPFLVQGMGDDRLVKRWGPFYTHSVIKGFDKTWILWPLVRRTSWTEGNVEQTKTQIFYFLYWRQEQRSISNPAAAPAGKTYLWPLVSIWDNGAGRRQIQLLSPLEGVFADNPRVREAWSPLFAIWRSDQRSPGETRTSVLWNAITWEASKAAGTSEFHLGPILGVRRGRSGTAWSVLGLKFASKAPAP